MPKEPKMPKAYRPHPGGKRPGAGRKKGVPNKVAQDIAVAARQYSHEALETIYAIMSDKKAGHAVRLTAALAILDRGHGKPTTHAAVDLELDPNLLSDSQLAAIIAEGNPELASKITVRNDGNGRQRYPM